jgi:hypothetical protein
MGRVSSRRSRRLASLPLAAALVLALVSGANASWSGTQFTLNPSSSYFVIQSHVRYQASPGGNVYLTLDNGVSKGVYVSIWKVTTSPTRTTYTRVTGWTLWGQQQLGKKNLGYVAGNTYWVPAAQIAQDCLSGCDLTYGGWFDYVGNENGA